MRVILTASLAITATIAVGVCEGFQRPSRVSLVRPIETQNPEVAKTMEVVPLGQARVVLVKNLGPSGPGSLRAALGEKGPRLVVFEVGGVIDLKGESLEIREPLAFVAGETAPAPGITLIRGSLIVETDHVVVRHLAVRPGDGRPDPSRPWEPDGISVVRGSAPVHDVLIENCSATWAVDENMSASGPRDTRPSAGPDATSHGVTFRRNLLAEGLLNSTHSKGAHSMGLLIHDGIREIVIEGNLFAHNRERNPRLKGGVEAVVTGNVMYDWGTAAIGVGSQGNLEKLDGVRAVVKGNVAIAGPDTKSMALVHALDPGASVDAGLNLTVDGSGASLKELEEGIGPLKESLGWAESRPGAEAKMPSAAATLAAVLRGAGARPAERDPIDRRIVDTVIAGAGRIIDSQNQVGGYPVRAETKRAVKVPEGGVARRAWLDGLMKDLATAGDLDIAPLLNRLKLPR